ncbi:MAG TPA: SLATT domain-containing protein [Acidimicrobiales bacterium]|nr:SLATT domain-containing protein [Acidimicrobiales bacterium]
MTERDTEMANLYRRYRLEHQKNFYRNRAVEYRTARNQARITAAAFLVLASLAGALGGADVGDWRMWWAVAATVLGGLAAALTSYEAIYGFDRQSRDYEKTIAALARLETRFPGEPCAPGAGGAEVAAFVQQAEAVFLGEVDRWAKHTSAPPTTDSAGPAPDPPPPPHAMEG